MMKKEEVSVPSRGLSYLNLKESSTKGIKESVFPSPHGDSLI